MSLRKAFLLFWVGGLFVFAIVIAIGLPLGIPGVPEGILDHQAAGTAARVNEIHGSWAAEGLLRTAKFAMAADLVFIGIYGLGSVLGGWYYWRTGLGVVKVLGIAVFFAGLVFLFTDYGETIAQFFQLMRDKGGNRLAGFAATMQPIKMVAWMVTFFGVIIAFAIRKIAPDASKHA